MSENISHLRTWEKPDKDLHDRVFSECFHNRGLCEIVEEAEHVIVLKEKSGGPQSAASPHGVVHVWVYLEQWSSCKTFSSSIWSKLDMPTKMADLQDRIRFLRSLQE